MFVLQNDMSKDIKFTGRWYILKSERAISDSRIGWVQETVYPRDTLFVEIEFEKNQVHSTTTFLWYEQRSYETIKVKKFVSEYDLIEIMECSK